MKRLSNKENDALFSAITERLETLRERIERYERNGSNEAAASERAKYGHLLAVLKKGGWRTKPWEM